MSSADPFNIVKEELKRSINKTKIIVESLNAIGSRDSSDHNANKLVADLRTNLRSITWDIQDLDETINIASKNPAKFNLDHSEIENRRQFIAQTKEFVQKTKNNHGIHFDESSTSTATTKTTTNKTPQNAINIRIPDVISNFTSSSKSNTYVKLNNNDNDFDDQGNEDDSDYEIDTRRLNSRNINSNKNTNSTNNSNNNSHSIQMQKHERIFREQDKNMDLISGKVSSLKNISQTMANELDDQAELMDDLGREMDTADSRINMVMKKMTKVMHMSNDRRQWSMIGCLLCAIVFVIFLLAAL